ncbi:ADP-ribose glycohydrolase MACROD1 [Psilocybe cubensis]|uniref:Macro domain-containing protein n=2 Tax=Psilocybe cubensis TaxID=181762 RepID=A0A8H7Y3L6_PSICU|nr:ADP-ribose glycohydrolase MACROD1 [Psilocybe cubensis]KAH9481571.1 ADP-ribose glycohydrolase MACROD1 [Psilocybe cubensis]
MSLDDIPPADPVSPPSPASISSVDSDIDDDMVRLSDINTVAHLYKTAVLKKLAADKLRHPVRPDLLDRVALFQGDITTLKIDAIVNAANRSLLVDGAIHSAAGPKLLEECRGLNGCATGESKITRGYNLPARHIIHTVGPVYSSKFVEERAEQLESCYKTSLQLAVENGLKHIAFPSVSTGIYSYPIVDATRIALNTVRAFLDTEVGNKLDRVIFVVWSDKDLGVYETLIPEYFPIGDTPAEDSAEKKTDSPADDTIEVEKKSDAAVSEPDQPAS